MGKLTSARNSQGFTLIELLIVVVIIGILAAIAIPQFATARERAFDSAAKSDIRNMMSLQEAYFADFQQYAQVTVASGDQEELGEAGTGIWFTASDQVDLEVTPATDPASYEIEAGHAQSTRRWCVDTAPSVVDSGKIVDCSP